MTDKNPAAPFGPPVVDAEINAENTTFDLNRHVARLLMDEPFFAALSRKINKQARTDIPTAGVTVSEDGHFQLLYNASFFEGLTDVQRAGVLKHEFYHLVFEHVTGRKPTEGLTRQDNICMDLAINSHLKGELPENCCMPGEGPFEWAPLGKTYEWYKANWPESEEPEGGEGEPGEGGEPGGEGGSQGSMDDMQFDDHDGWGEGKGLDREIAKERLKEAVKQAANEASKAGSWGSVPGECRREILDRIATRIDWRKMLRYFIKTSQRANKQSTVRRINKRYPYIHAGKRVNRHARIAISIDQSGSVSDEMLAAFFSELSKLAKHAEFTVVPFDTEVAEEYVYVWKRNETKKWERVRFGGTCFNAPTKWVNQRGFDGHIVLTDLCAPKPVASKCQRRWMTTKQYAERPYFQTNERVVAIDV